MPRKTPRKKSERERQAHRELARRRHLEGYLTPKNRLRRQMVAELWHAQKGLCYLCHDPVPLDEAVLEHDHRCCKPGDFCQFCVRGVSCVGCNNAIGGARDDPERLRVIADSLEAMLPIVTARLATRPLQEELDMTAG